MKGRDWAEGSGRRCRCRWHGAYGELMGRSSCDQIRVRILSYSSNPDTHLRKPHAHHACHATASHAAGHRHGLLCITQDIYFPPERHNCPPPTTMLCSDFNLVQPRMLVRNGLPCPKDLVPKSKYRVLVLQSCCLFGPVNTLPLPSPSSQNTSPTNSYRADIHGNCGHARQQSTNG